MYTLNANVNSLRMVTRCWFQSMSSRNGWMGQFLNPLLRKHLLNQQLRSSNWWGLTGGGSYLTTSCSSKLSQQISCLCVYANYPNLITVCPWRQNLRYLKGRSIYIYKDSWFQRRQEGCRKGWFVLPVHPLAPITMGPTPIYLRTDLQTPLGHKVENPMKFLNSKKS